MTSAPTPTTGSTSQEVAERKKPPEQGGGGLPVSDRDACTQAETAYWQAIGRYKETGKGEHMQEAWTAFDKWNALARIADRTTTT